jgi:hypothetical protein
MLTVYAFSRPHQEERQEPADQVQGELHSKTHLPSCMFLGLPSNSDGGPMRPKRTRGQAPPWYVSVALVRHLSCWEDRGTYNLEDGFLNVALNVQEEIVSKYSELHSKTHLPSCMFLGLPSNSDGGPTTWKMGF